ncbi:hypothetical protein PROFUN_01278 [Planoprotostelium fungivorum]|uniref:COX assembly mitochondrial protein n=1 Tax=Planoprotostelium fungivorum TaxID=1890364 RepID=A0A2P6NZL3_9EUKA|nr:hypothetical protein PROFUN_01278 [Planoprotostelium fungivorum]
MHPPLDLHLHDRCKKEIMALHTCHAENPYKKFIGECNDVRRVLDKCLQLEFDDKMEERKTML